MSNLFVISSDCPNGPKEFLLNGEAGLLFQSNKKNELAKKLEEFCNLLEELTKITNTRFIIVTHHALTMSKMDKLYGVTMPEKGISQLVAVDLEKAESMVA